MSKNYIKNIFIVLGLIAAFCTPIWIAIIANEFQKDDLIKRNKNPGLACVEYNTKEGRYMYVKCK